MSTTTYSQAESAAPATKLFIVTLLAGVAATVVFDLFGQWLSPLLGFSKLAPAALARQSLTVLFGGAVGAYGGIMHYVTGIVFYSLAYVLIARPLAQAIVPGIHWLITAIVYGVVLWVFALYVMAHLVAGNPPFLGFSNITWVALVGHIVFTVVLGAIIHAIVGNSDR